VTGADGIDEEGDEDENVAYHNNDNARSMLRPGMRVTLT
jgi:hypothetical protein